MTPSQLCSHLHFEPALHPDSLMKYLQGLSTVELDFDGASFVVDLEGVLGSPCICFSFRGTASEGVVAVAFMSTRVSASARRH